MWNIFGVIILIYSNCDHTDGKFTLSQVLKIPKSEKVHTPLKECGSLDDHACTAEKLCPKEFQVVATGCDDEVCCRNYTKKCSYHYDQACTSEELCPKEFQVVATGCDDEVCCRNVTKIYVLQDSTKTWDDAKKDCEYQEGHLAMFDEADEVVAVMALRNAGATIDADYWFGAKAEAPGDWRYLDGTPLAGEMTGIGTTEEGMLWGDTDFDSDVDGFVCMKLTYQANGFTSMNDADCDLEKKFICQLYITE